MFFFACCVLNNMLHTFDGMDDPEESVNWVGSAVPELQSTREHNVDSARLGRDRGR